MGKPKIAISLLGQSGICTMSIDMIRNHFQDIEIEGIYDDSALKINTVFQNILIKDSINNYVNSASPESHYIMCIGNMKHFKARIDYSNSLQKKGANSFTLVHPQSFISQETDLGDGNWICANVSIESNAKLGSGNIIFNNSVIEHDSIINDNCYLSPSSTVCGKVTISDNVYIGPGAIISAGVFIGKNVIIGAGAVVLRDVPEDCVFWGNPAKFIKMNDIWGGM